MRDAQIRYLERSNRARGQILSLASMVERTLDGMLSRYFSRDENHQRELIELIFATERMNFRGKYKLLIDILRKKLGENFSKEFPQLQNKFDDATSIRNKFAHESDIPFDETSTIPDYVFEKYDSILLIMRDVTKTKGYTTQEIDELITQISSLSEWTEKAEKVLFGDGQVTQNNNSGNPGTLY